MLRISIRRVRFENLSLITAMLFATGLIFTGTAWADAEIPFVAETVDATGQTGYGLSLAYDSKGNPHIVYNNATDDLVLHAERTGGVWSLETIATGVTAQRGTDIFLDSSDTPHVVYLTFSAAYYATRSGGVWSTELAYTNAGGSIGNFISLAIDSQGNPHVAFVNDTADAIMYVRKSGTWNAETVDSFASVSGTNVSLQLDVDDVPWISYYDVDAQDLNVANRSGGSWSNETVDSGGIVGRYSSLALGSDDTPRVSYYDASLKALKYAVRNEGWSIDTVDTSGNTGLATSLVLASDGSPFISYVSSTPARDVRLARWDGGSWIIQVVGAKKRAHYEYTGLALDKHDSPAVAYQDLDQYDLHYTDSALELRTPNGGETWAVGSVEDIVWHGGGAVNVYLSVDGGNSFSLLESAISGGDLGGGTLSLRVPHQPTHFAMIRVERASPFSSAKSDSSFTIEASISMLMLSARPGDGGGVLLSWNTDPGPEDLGGYKIERSRSGGAWDAIQPFTRETSYHDVSGGPGMRYRLTAINGLGEEIVLGETMLTPRAALSAWPLPYRGGDLSISFATFGGRGGGPGAAELSVFDLNGRLVRTIARGDFAAGVQTAFWDGRDTSGRPVASGVYFLRSTTAGETAQMRMVVVR